ncbi:unnamed protein product [Blepharisma stoltei]|uniref:Uncharacterized protein n=1 Tax=Blepharisma stoltei TaxID=1481888 RepID=A0AAU9K3F9_9CILI|nr:unnamed protein product [Blepharisma stoltei]
MEDFFVSTQKPKPSKLRLFSIIGILGAFGVLATILVISISSASPILAQLTLEETEFQNFMTAYSKTYSSEEEYQAKFQIFRDNLAYIRIFNSLGNNWTLGANKFADLTFSEFKAKFSSSPVQKSEKNIVVLDPLTAPSAIDWTTKGAVTPVKNQGECGSGWAFSASGAVEGAWYLSGHTILSLSTQEILDCSTTFGNNGCNGGTVDNAFKYIISKGLTSDQNYPYKGVDGACSKTKVAMVNATISNYTDVTPDNVNQLYAAVAKGPVSVSVDSSQEVWQFYKGGIVDKNCGTSLDHGVLIVGYNQTNTPAYWKVKNSWGPDWGEQGYIRIGVKNGAGVCGIQMQPSYPKV